MHNINNDNYLLVFVSCQTAEQARCLANLLVEQKLAACVQISSPITSVYSWENKICEQQEISLQIKCSAKCYSTLEKTIIAAHSYEVPEIIAIPITQGLPAYLNWIKDNSQP